MEHLSFSEWNSVPFKETLDNCYALYDIQLVNLYKELKGLLVSEHCLVGWIGSG